MVRKTERRRDRPNPLSFAIAIGIGASFGLSSSIRTRPVGTLRTGRIASIIKNHNVFQTYRQAQNSKAPFPLPIRVSLPCKPMELVSFRRPRYAKSYGFSDLYADWNIGEDPQMNLRALDNFDPLF